MKMDKFGRRMFLTGAGVSVALPFLPSLLRREARAAESDPVRYIQIINEYGTRTPPFFGSLRGGEEVLPNVRIRDLTAVEGNISSLINSSFDSLRGKINLLHGMDMITENANHQLTFPTCASGYRAGRDGYQNPPESNQPSVDVMISDSDVVYDSGWAAARRLLVLSPGGDDQITFSWRHNSNDVLERVRPLTTTLGLQDILAFGSLANDLDESNEELLLNAIYEDYQSVRDNARISKEDQLRLESYMSLVQDHARNSGGSADCDAPSLDEEEDTTAMYRNYFRLIAAALQCDLTRVVSLVPPIRVPDAHSVHHEQVAWGDANPLDDDFKRIGGLVADLLGTLDSTVDGDGTLLDNSVVYWNMQYGNAISDNVHRDENLPALVAGGARGQLETGYYIDYRRDPNKEDLKTQGVPINNLLVTFMNCMGLSSDHYESPEKPGYGYYADHFFELSSRPDTEFWNSTEGRRSPLPFLYKGQARG